MGVNIGKTGEGGTDLALVVAGLGWKRGWVEGDLDLSVLLLDRTGKLADGRAMVFYNNLLSSDGAVASSGDDRSGGGGQDNETISIDLERVDARVVEILICASIHEAQAKALNFGQIENAYVRVLDVHGSQVIRRCELDEDFSTSTAVELGRLLRVGRSWQFEYLGRGHAGGLEAVVRHYGTGMNISLGKGETKPAVSGGRPADCDPRDLLAQLVGTRPFDGYCATVERNALLREAELLGLAANAAEIVLDLELESRCVANEHALLARLGGILRQFTDNDKKLDDKERRDALQLACRPAAGYRSGLRYDVAEDYITQFCRANRVKVKLGFMKWAVP
jgi:tellurium resistance protein TerD